jgi:hypothetical protein
MSDGGTPLERLVRGSQSCIDASASSVRRPLLDRSTRRFELRRIPPSPDAIDEPAAGQVLKRGDLLGEHDRVVGRQHEHRGSEQDPRSDRRDVAEGHQRLGPADPVETLGGQQVVGDEQRIEAELFRAGGKSADLVAVPVFLTRQKVRGKEDAELQMDSRAKREASRASTDSIVMGTRMPETIRPDADGRIFAAPEEVV